MKKFKLGSLITLFAMTLFLFSCGDSDHDHSHDGDAHETTQTDENTQPEANAEETSAEESDKTGKEYTSAFVCPMHCEGSGSHEAGKCPVCGMDYVANADFKPEGEGDHEGHDH
jgi:hypothetical protein